MNIYETMIFAARSLLQRFETREYSFGLSGRSADVFGHYCRICCDFPILHHPCLGLVHSGSRGAHRLWPVQGRRWARGDHLDFLWHPRGGWTAVQFRRILKFTLQLYSLFDSSSLECTSHYSIWPRRFFVRSRMTEPWTGGVWELCSMRWSTAWYVCSLLQR